MLHPTLSGRALVVIFLPEEVPLVDTEERVDSMQHGYGLLLLVGLYETPCLNALLERLAEYRAVRSCEYELVTLIDIFDSMSGQCA